MVIKFEKLLKALILKKKNLLSHLHKLIKLASFSGKTAVYNFPRDSEFFLKLNFEINIFIKLHMEIT